MAPPRSRVRRGVYQIRCLVNGRVYVGSSENLTMREQKHWWRLRNGTHSAKRMLSDFRLYGRENFVFEVLEEPNPNVIDLYPREDYWLEKLRPFDPEIGYNTHFVSTSSLGTIRDDEVRRNISNGRMGMKFTEEHKGHIAKANTGAVFSPERCANISAARKASDKAKKAIGELNASKRVLPREQVVKVVDLRLSGLGPQAIADELQVSRRVVRAILEGETYTEITGITRRGTFADVQTHRRFSEKASQRVKAYHAQRRGLSPENVLKIVAMHNDGYSNVTIAASFNIHRDAVRAILAGEIYTEITGRSGLS
jgi:group I intron endonuclease